MPIILDGTAGIDNDATDLSYTGTLTGGTGVVNLGSGQLFKDASGNVGIGTSSPIANRRVTIKNSTTGGSASALYLEGTYGGANDTTGIDFGGNNGIPLAVIRQVLRNSVTGASALLFGTSPDGTTPVERMRLDSDGNLLVGSSTEVFNTRMLVRFTGSGTSTTGIVVFGGGASGQSFMGFTNSGGGGTGSITQSGAGTAYNTSSDYRLKHDIQPMTGALARVAALKPVTYKWNADNSADEGFIAHELAEVCPSAVSGEKDAVNEDGSIKPQGIDTSFLVATLTAAIQELKAINDAQAQTIESLTARVVALENQIV